MRADYYHFQLGDIECACLYDGYHDYKLEQMVTNASRQDVEAALQAHGLSTHVFTTPYTHLYVNTGEHRILVDVGGGDLFPTTGKIQQSMHNAKIRPESIDTIFITHAHPDHVGGVSSDRGELIFTQAAYYICKTEWDFWFSEQAVTLTGEWMVSFARKKLKPLEDKIVLIESEGEIIPDVSVLLSPGHTPGHMAISFTSQGERLFSTGDTVLHPLHLEHPMWLPVFDILPESAAESKRRIFDLAAATGCLVVGQHFSPFPSLGHVVKKGLGWEWHPIVSRRPNDNETDRGYVWI